MNAAETIRALRKQKGVSQEKLAAELKIDRSTIGKYETGDRVPDAEMLCRLADFFEVSVDYLLGRKTYQ